MWVSRAPVVSSVSVSVDAHPTPPAAEQFAAPSKAHLGQQHPRKGKALLLS